MAIEKVGVIGCGLMGSGIAETCARSGYQTTVHEPTDELLQRGLARIRGSMSRAVAGGKLTQEGMDEALARISGTTDLKVLGGSDLIIEAIVEDMAEKKRLYAQLDAVCPPHTIFCTNTSTLTVIEMATATHRMDRFVGLHFFNPAPVMRLVEVIRTIRSSDETVEMVRHFAESLGKTAILAQDSPGFIVNRLLIPYLLEAVRLLESGVATKEDIDQGMILGCGHPMGPFTLLDFVGLDTAYYVANAMFEEFKDPRFAPPPLLKRMVLAGDYGRKTGQGFYRYS
ncbi:MAG: 3-hydroxybutyryl-CoA dehydrogenase [Chloroflexi bacterium]|nr:3-hydroxybutyryl-CoA dehydrogenase [Chloroflexota bacterium]